MAISIQGFQATQTSTTTSVHPTRGIRAQIKQDVQQLSTALQAGDLATAQKSYGDLQKLLQGNGSISKASTATVPASSTTSSVPSGPLDTVRNDFQSLGKDLQSGDLAAAQKDYAQLAKDSQQLVAQQEAAGGGRADGHHHGHDDPGQDGNSRGATSGTTTSTTSSSTTSTTTPPATGTVSTDVTPAASSPSPVPTPQTAGSTSSSYQFSIAASYSSLSTGARASTSPRIANSFTDPTTDPFAALKKDFETIGKDLQAGNLDGVQKDYAQLVTDAQSIFSPSGSASTALTPSSPTELSPASSTPPSTSSATSPSADHFSLNASFQSTSATVTSDNQSANYQSASFEESLQVASSNQQGSQVSAYQFKASFQSQSVNVFA